ncbi:hypothetical protein ALC53_09596 [Atta colombica]|uniref:Uncharacterized protein n=1 Tax=Atta colombica TaxID=520822 RepID=A0A151I167_9HYME|nr:hypothetical protein ALC53_09596 [Atta colombica]
MGIEQFLRMSIIKISAVDAERIQFSDMMATNLRLAELRSATQRQQRSEWYLIVTWSKGWWCLICESWGSSSGTISKEGIP